MIEIGFAKLHGDENDFLITWGDTLLPELDLPQVARRICARTTGVGADGWTLIWQSDQGLRTKLFNADGSEAEISGNGTRCSAAFAYWKGAATGSEVVITTAAGPKTLKLMERNDTRFLFEMNMGLPDVEALRESLTFGGTEWDATVLNVGNPQCAIFVDEFPPNWRAIAAEAEASPRFPNRSNISLVKVISAHELEVVFFERGAGETRSSGTGSTGAATAAILRGYAKTPVQVKTPAGNLHLRWDDSVYLTGPAELICEGTFLYSGA